MPKAEFTETTESIFSSNIETINTVGNVLFTENVATFYQNRRLYKTSVCDSVYREVTRNVSFSTLKGTLEFNYMLYAITSCGLMRDMQRLYDQNKLLMEISDGEIDAYRKQREQIDKGRRDNDMVTDSLVNGIIQLQMTIDGKKEQLNLE